MKTYSGKSRKQRRILFSLAKHRLSKIFSAHLSPALGEKYGVKRVTLRKGDTVRIERGDFSGIEGKINSMERERHGIFVENVTVKRADGSSKPVPIHPSNVVVTALNLDDKLRKQALEEQKEE